MYQHQFCCGPVAVTLASGIPELLEKVAVSLGQYNAAWQAPSKNITITLSILDSVVEAAAGDFMTCARMNVDISPLGLTATTMAGAWCDYDESKEHWSVFLPTSLLNEDVGDLLEDFINLALTTSWRQLGWVPVHAASITKNNCCALLCATSGGGKTSLTASLIRQGWKTLGDDKVLVRIGEGNKPFAGALVHHFNLHPRSSDWFPEVGDLSLLPAYSRWTDKRKVTISSIWPDRAVISGQPTHLGEVVRRNDIKGIDVYPLAKEKILPILLKQTVLPHNLKVAGNIISTIASVAQKLKGFRIEIGDNAYLEGKRSDGRSPWMSELEAVLL